MVPGEATGGDGDHRDLALERFRTISGQALQSNLRRLDRLEEAVDAAFAGALDDADRNTAVRAAHTLAGSAGTFGFLGVTPLAQSLEQLLQRDDLEPDDLMRARGRLSEIRTLLAAERESLD